RPCVPPPRARCAAESRGARHRRAVRAAGAGARGAVTRVVLASGNEGKLRELAALLAPLSLTLVPQGALGIAAVPETGTSFLANALLKARHAAQCAALPALADDAGLDTSEKNSLSHRARALRGLVARLGSASYIAAP